MTSKELIAKLDSHMRVNKITRKSVADKLGVSSAEVSRKLAADNCGLREFIDMLNAVSLPWLLYFKHKEINAFVKIDIEAEGLTEIAIRLETSRAHVIRMLASENMKLSTFLKLTDAAGVTNDYFKFD
jgi:DNA-directed RNA polymerase specialized sigma subunit